MKAKYKILNYLLILGLLVLFLKPALIQSMDHQVQQNTQYSTSTAPCSSGIVSVCQTNLYYTMADEQYHVAAYFFLLASILYFLVVLSRYKSPDSSIFRPPIQVN